MDVTRAVDVARRAGLDLFCGGNGYLCSIKGDAYAGWKGSAQKAHHGFSSVRPSAGMQAASKGGGDLKEHPKEANCSQVHKLGKQLGFGIDRQTR